MTNRKRKHYRKGGKGVTKINHAFRDNISGDFSYSNPTPDSSVGFIEENNENKGVKFEEPIDYRLNNNNSEFHIKNNQSNIKVEIPLGLSIPYRVTTSNQIKTIGNLPIDSDFENMYTLLRNGIAFENLEDLNNKLYAQELYLFHTLRSVMISPSEYSSNVSPVELFGSVLASGLDNLSYGLTQDALNELVAFINTLGIIRAVKNGNGFGQKLNRIASTDVLNRIDLDEIDSKYVDQISHTFKNPAVEDTISKIEKMKELFKNFSTPALIERTKNTDFKNYALDEDAEPVFVEDALLESIVSGDYSNIEDILPKLGLEDFEISIETFKSNEFENNSFVEQTDEVKQKFAEYVIAEYINKSKPLQNKIKQFNQMNSLLGIKTRPNTKQLNRKISNGILLENSIKSKNTEFEDNLGILLQISAEAKARKQKQKENSDSLLNTGDQQKKALNSLLNMIEGNHQTIELPQKHILEFEPITFKPQSSKRSLRKKTNL